MSQVGWTATGTLDDLAERVIEQVHECIGCNDCMLACPLPETTIVTIGALNEAVMAPTVEAENVRAFVTACTQCQQCVPVCPADLSRADMVLFNKLKVADQTADRPVVAQIGTNVVASEWRLDALCRHLAGTAMLARIGQATIRRMVLASTLHWLAPGDVLVAEESFHDRLYIVVRGRVAQTAKLEGGARVELLMLVEGSFVGEMATLADRRDAYGLVAKTNTEVLAVPKSAVLELRRTSEPFRMMLDAAARERAMKAFAERSPMIGSLPESTREALVAEGTLRMMPAGQALVERGGALAAFVIVQSGFFRVSTAREGRERTLFYLREGDDFGAMFVLYGSAYTSDVTITAHTRATVLEIPLDSLSRALVAHPDAKRALIHRATAELQQATKASSQVDRKAPGTGGDRDLLSTSNYGLNLSMMLDKGVLAGTQVLAIDVTKCTDCNNCVDACGRRHGTPRLERRGLQLDHILFPSACRHCDDPVCLMCSVNGIVRKPGGEIAIVEDNCIGCGSCADRCPYGNITMQPREPVKATGFKVRLASMLVPSNKPRSNEWLKRPLGSFIEWLQGGAPTGPIEEEGPMVAVKCDLCEGYGDQACVNACPTGAAFRFDPTTVFSAQRLATMGQDDEA